MATMTVRNLPDDVHRRIKFVAVQRGLSAEATVSELLDEATRPAEKLGDIVASFARKLDVDFPEIKRMGETLDAADFDTGHKRYLRTYEAPPGSEHDRLAERAAGSSSVHDIDQFS